MKKNSNSYSNKNIFTALVILAGLFIYFFSKPIFAFWFYLSVLIILLLWRVF